MKNIVLCLMMFFSAVGYAQHNLKVAVKDIERKEPLAGATVSIDSLGRSVAADTSGIAQFKNVPAGTYRVKVSFVGFEEIEVILAVPRPGDEIFEVFLSGEDEEEEVIVTTTRTSRTIGNTPTRTEVISGEELEEKGNMKPGDIRMLLSESTGIQVQQTSATSYNAGIRIQGLDGRYTQILRDGYPLYAGFAGGLSILQIAPLDLKQVEVIKGSSSTLYGGGAIAGLVNLISKTPTTERELNFIANGTTAGGSDLSGYYSQRFGKAGITLYSAHNRTSPYDPADIGLTAIPKASRITVNPRLFLYGKKTTADVGASYITEDRIGGNVSYIKNGGAGFFEENNTDRVTTTFGIAHRLGDSSTIQLKNSYTRFNRTIRIPDSRFEALQQSSFSELTWMNRRNETEWVLGANLLTDDLAEKVLAAQPARDYHYNTYGIFIQNLWLPIEQFTLESGLRGDYIPEYGFELLPRVSAMYKFSSKLTSRIGFGFGYKPPTVFTEESERIQFRGVLPINQTVTRNEEALSGNWDINYRTNIGSIEVSFNHLFFYTKLNAPLVLAEAPNNRKEFRNATGHIDTKGMETNLRFIMGDLKLFVGYTYTNANTHFTNNKEWLPLTARHRLNHVLMYEIEDKLKLGLEAYYFSAQTLNDGTMGRPYWITGFMAEKLWEKYSVFINFENFTNTRQSRFDTIYTGPIDQPAFRDIYAPVEGFVVNGGIKLRL